MAKYDHIDFTPPAGVRAEAQKGLDWRSEFGRGGTAVGIARARDLSNGTNISPDTARRMKAYFDRHEVDKQGKGWSPGEDGFPSNGRIAWALWGSDPGYAWARKLVEQLNAADEESRMIAGTIERRSLAIDDTESDKPLLAVERRGRKSPLETRALWNHDPNYPLARFPGTLKMSVDEVGLRYEFPVPDTTYGRDLASNISAGIVRGSSFSFQIAPGGDEWSIEDGRSIRTVKRVASLIDVGPVTFPAYPDADAKVAKRAYDAFRQQRSRQSMAALHARTKSKELREWMERHGK